MADAGEGASSKGSVGMSSDQTPVEVQNGFAYVVRPPMWPIGNTPGQRGGVKVSSIAPAVHMVLVAEPGVERVFCLGGRDEAGKSVACTMTVETIEPPGVQVRSANVTEGWYVERLRDQSGSAGRFTALRYDTLPVSHPIRQFLASIKPGQSGSGGIGTSAGSGVVSGAAGSVRVRAHRVGGGSGGVS